MTRRFSTLAILLAIACDGSPPRPDGGDAGMIREDAGFDAGIDASRDADVSVDAGVVEWPARTCDLTIRHAPPVGVTSVQIAGEFTGWADAPLPMRDDDGDGTYEITFSPSARLVPGELYAYKLIVGTTWILDPSATLRKYADACLNSAFRMPACTLAPEIRAGELTTAYDTASDTGSAAVRIEISTATDGAAPQAIALTIDGRPLETSERAFDGVGGIDVALSGLAPGRHELSVRVTDASGRDALPVDLPFWIEEAPFEWRDSLMYMIVVDRFANGDRSTDASEGVEYPSDFHGGDLEGVLAAMESGYFESLGVNVLWLSPINQQATGQFPGRDDAHPYAGYHGYWPSRARDVEPRFGGNDALRALVDEAHRRGIRVLLDLINNQIHQQHEYYATNPEWFRTGCVCGLDAGCGWSERPLDCLFASYLPDINWRVPAAEAQFIADAVHWVDAYDVDGFRIDAVKHVETNSIANLRAALHQRFEQGGERLFLVGETAVGANDMIDYGCDERYTSGYAWIDAYVGENALDGQFDFPTHHALQGGLVPDTMSFRDVENVVRTLETRYRPEGLHVRFLGTHDSNRMASRAAFDPAQGCRWPDSPSGCTGLPGTPTDPIVFDRLRRAFTVLFTMPGIPFVYYGDEIGMPGGNDPDNRRDMVWTGALASLAMGDTSLNAEQEMLRAHLAALGTARARSIALRRGRRIPLYATNDLYVYAYAIEGDLAVIAVNRGGAVSGLAIDGLGTASVGDVTAFDAIAGSGALTISGARLTLTIEAGGAAIFQGR